MEHDIVVDSIGGATVISCRALDFYNLELSGKVNKTDIKKSILRQKNIKPDDERAKFTVKIIDQRPKKEEDFNAKRKRESLEHKPKSNLL